MLNINVTKAVTVVIEDERSYVPELSHNGGCYWFATEYLRVAPDEWIRRCSNSSEFDIDDDDWIVDDAFVINELLLVDAISDENYFIAYVG